MDNDKPVGEAPMLSEVLYPFSKRFKRVLYTQSVGIPATKQSEPTTIEPIPK